MSIEEAMREVAPGFGFGFTHAAGVDPSLSGTGVASIDADGAAVTFLVPKRPSVSTTDVPANDDRLRAISGDAVQFVPAGALVLIERLYVPQGRGKDGDLIARAGLWNFIVRGLRDKGCTVVSVAPATRAKLATGNGGSKKDDVMREMRRRFPGVPLPDDNTCDALALASAAAAWAGLPVPEPLNQGQNEAMTTVVWPLRRGSN
ncbi:hypothetical protein SCB71_06470 [Herbiconiux sp. KACC 21604]|uniref:hypothetical protein n=1 Tax=unclassified Herbiconiux TaxID=2618217 RepID=UPI001491C484|nr:hypothetical protein [Herbiconiux sp. SALV-R1]QJU52959.1 hypothetical protein HL652_04455 [Herbiconiux sp. SALV-R1]WPO87883.1 hypothetical protein SCB71_06470 [Herbiconiux sp. KACC 21604]